MPQFYSYFDLFMLWYSIWVSIYHLCWITCISATPIILRHCWTIKCCSYLHVGTWWVNNCIKFCAEIPLPRKLPTNLGGYFLCRNLYIHFWGLLPPNGILPGAKFTLCLSLAFSYIGGVTARQSRSGRQPNFAAWYKESCWEWRAVFPHLYLSGRPSRGTSVPHFLVSSFFPRLFSSITDWMSTTLPHCTDSSTLSWVKLL